MKITRPSKSNIKKICICPSCGETRSFYEYFAEGKFKGVLSGTYKSWVEGFFKMKTMRVDCYSCCTCGCKWESDPYEQ